MSSASFLAVRSSISLQRLSVSFWRSSSNSFRSSSVISDFFFMALNFSMASRRMLRMATLPPSPYFFTCLVSSLRRSSVS